MDIIDRNSEKDESKIKIVKKAKNSRTKGHNWEREIAKMFREDLEFKNAKTSRYASRLLDDCKVDIAGVPFLIQAKAGYEKNRPKFEEIFKEIETELLKNYNKTDKIHQYPKVIIHKLSGKSKYHNFAIMPYNDFKALLLKLKPELHKL